MEYPAQVAPLTDDESVKEPPPSVSFVGSHLDVVYANPADWERG